MATAAERIVVQTTPREKRAIVAKARRLGLPISELMRRGAVDYRPRSDDDRLAALADAARSAAEGAAGAIDAALAFIARSNRRIAAMESKRAIRTRAGAKRRRG
jgi:hypothetical protein